MMKLVHKALSCESMLRPAVENSGSNVISRRNHDFDEDTCEPMPIVDAVDDGRNRRRMSHLFAEECHKQIQRYISNKYRGISSTNTEEYPQQIQSNISNKCRG